MGNISRQAYSADTFCLGLSFLHLLTGEEPYEELLKEIRCPTYLFEALSCIWNPAKMDIDNPYYVIKEVIESLDPGDEGDDGDSADGNSAGADGDDRGPGAVLFDTIYRYVVLFGVHADMIPQDSGHDCDGNHGAFSGIHFTSSADNSFNSNASASASASVSASRICTNRNGYDGGVRVPHPWLENPVWNAVLDAIGCPSKHDHFALTSRTNAAVAAAAGASVAAGTKGGKGKKTSHSAVSVGVMGGSDAAFAGRGRGVALQKEQIEAKRQASVAQFHRDHGLWCVCVRSHPSPQFLTA